MICSDCQGECKNTGTEIHWSSIYLRYECSNVVVPCWTCRGSGEIKDTDDTEVQWPVYDGDK